MRRFGARRKAPLARVPAGTHGPARRRISAVLTACLRIHSSPTTDDQSTLVYEHGYGDNATESLE